MADIRESLYEDLELSFLFQEMSKGNHAIYDVVKEELLHPVRPVEDILKRQELLKDSMANPALIRDFYDLLCKAAALDRDAIFQVSTKKPKYMLGLSTDLLLSLLPYLKQLFQMSKKLQASCSSSRIKEICEYIDARCNDEQLSTMKEYLGLLNNTEDFSVITYPGSHFRPENYIITQSNFSGNRLKSLLFSAGKNKQGFDVDEGDEESNLALGALKNAALHEIASLLTAVKEQLFSYIKALKKEFAFQAGCLNLKDTLDHMGVALTIPVLCTEPCQLSFENLRNVTLTLQNHSATIGNTITCDGHPIITVTGANQGGKTTWLRSLGQATLMAQAGMFVAASSFRATLSSVYTHFIREEDRELKSGKLDEELVRMSEIVSHIQPGDLLLMNESFSSTNEEEGSDIALEIVSALLQKNIRVVYVTHFYRLIQLLNEKELSPLSLNAQRNPDGSRTYQLSVKAPEVHGHGEDLYKEIFYN